MKETLTTIIFLTTLFTSGQTSNENFLINRSGNFFFHLGTSKNFYDISDIQFEGETYSFLVEQVEATDNGTPGTSPANSSRIDLPINQFNWKVGYYTSGNTYWALGLDRLNYNITHGQEAYMSGYTNFGGRYINREEVVLTDALLESKYLQNINYTFIEYGVNHELLSKRRLALGLIGAGGVGITHSKRTIAPTGTVAADNFRITGIGLNAQVGLNAELPKIFYVQTELKAGFTRFAQNYADKVSEFYADYYVIYGQLNISIGAYIIPRKR